MPQFMSIRQTTKATGISESLIRRLVREGQCPGFYSGKKYTVNVDALVEMLSGMKGEQLGGNSDESC